MGGRLRSYGILEKVSPGKAGGFRSHALRAIPERNFRVLRVIYNETVEPVAVVTAYFDDEAADL